MSTLLLCLAIGAVVIYFEWELVQTALTPIVDIAVSVWFIIMLLIVITAELVLIPIAPIALLLGIESRRWHFDIAARLFRRKKNADAN